MVIALPDEGTVEAKGNGVGRKIMVEAEVTLIERRASGPEAQKTGGWIVLCGKDQRR